MNAYQWLGLVGAAICYACNKASDKRAKKTSYAVAFWVFIFSIILINK
jgi:hypothetical protein